MNEVDLTISVVRKEAGPLRLVATLTLAAALSGLALASVYQVTKPIIDANDAAALRTAVLQVVPGAASLQRVASVDGTLTAVADGAVAPGPVVYGAYDETGRFLGYAIEGSGPGFQDTIRLLYGYDPAQRRVIGLAVLDSRETPGLGDKIWKDDAFVGNFGALAVAPSIVVVKDGRDDDNEVDAITGATISSKAVVQIINEANETWSPTLDSEPPPPLAPPVSDTVEEQP